MVYSMRAGPDTRSKDPGQPLQSLYYEYGAAEV